MKVTIIVVLVYNVLELSYMLLIPFVVPNPNRRTWVVSIDELATTTITMVVLLVVSIKMSKLLNMFEESGSSFEKQKRSVILQAVFFVTAFVFIDLTQILFYIGSFLQWQDAVYAII